MIKAKGGYKKTDGEQSTGRGCLFRCESVFGAKDCVPKSAQKRKMEPGNGRGDANKDYSRMQTKRQDLLDTYHGIWWRQNCEFN